MCSSSSCFAATERLWNGFYLWRRYFILLSHTYVFFTDIQEPALGTDVLISMHKFVCKPCNICRGGSFSLSFSLSFFLSVFLSLSCCNQEEKNPYFSPNRPFYWEQNHKANFCRQFLFNTVDIIFASWIISLNVLMQFVISYTDVFQVYLEHFSHFLLKTVFRC